MINIDIKDAEENRRKFATVALTVDRDDFLAEVEVIRKKYGIDVNRDCPHFNFNRGYFKGLLKGNFDNNDLLRLWFAVEYNGLHGFIKDKNVYKPDPGNQKQQTNNLLNKVIKLRYKDDKTRKFCDEFATTTSALRKKLNLSPQMEKVIAHAILCNLVREDDLHFAYAYVNLEKGKDGIFTTLEDFIMKISLQATLKDVVDAYNRDVKPFQVQAYGVDTTVPLETKGEIVRDRKRYWKNKQGLGYKMIAAEETGLDKYKKAKRTHRTLIRIPNNEKQKTEKEEAERILDYVENTTPGVKKSVQRYKSLLAKTVQNLLDK